MKDVSRRDVLKVALVGTTVGVSGLVLTRQAEAGAEATSAETAETYDYKDRRITLVPTEARIAGARSVMSAVFIDGRPLHVMRYPNGEYSSVMNHFETFPTLRDTAQAAVEALNGANLAPMHHN